MSESLSQQDELREQLDQLRSLIDSPLNSLNAFFLNLKTEVAAAFDKKLTSPNTSPDDKLKLNENCRSINEKINEFELECISKLNKVNKSSDENEAIKLISSRLDQFDESFYTELSDMIYDESCEIERVLFRNKTMFFLDKAKCKQMEDKTCLSEDDTDLESGKRRNCQSSNASEDSNESFNEEVNLFYNMNKKSTVGKLVFINNEFFGKKCIPILKYGSDCIQDRLTSEIVKSTELRKRMEKSLTKSPNQIDEISIDVHGSNLNKLDFSFYELKSIQTSIFKSTFVHLKYINLSDNEISSLETVSSDNESANNSIFSDLHDLRSISLASNKLTHINANTFRWNKNLNEINLADNQLTDMAFNVFQGLKRLELIYLNKNRLTQIDSYLFNGLVELKWLYLDNNKLELIHSNTFASNKKLIELNLSGNRLSLIQSGLFSGLADLEDINLRFNQINQIPVDLFHSLIKIKSIDLSNNELCALDPSQFNGLTELTFVNLSSNKIVAFDKYLFYNLTKIKSIDLSYNINSDSICFSSISNNQLPIKW